MCEGVMGGGGGGRRRRREGVQRCVPWHQL